MKRDPERIDPLLTELKRLWNRFPHLRFHQLVAYISLNGDSYYTEDDIVLQNIKKRLSE